MKNIRSAVGSQSCACTSLIVKGTLIASGAEDAPIVFGGGHPSAGWLDLRVVDAPIRL